MFSQYPLFRKVLHQWPPRPHLSKVRLLPIEVLHFIVVSALLTKSLGNPHPVFFINPE
jgi:hypothetical protein